VWLGVTVALEHFTALFAHEFLAQPDRYIRGDNEQAELWRWHSVEEIEHKAVAYDVLQKVAPSYPLRVAGMFMATTTLLGFWFLGAAMLLRQEKGLGLREIFRQLRLAMQANPLGRRVFVRGIREYLRRDFHPWQTDNLALARSYLARIEQATAAA
jgi:predicted metal-dependent hydrolase